MGLIISNPLFGHRLFCHQALPLFLKSSPEASTHLSSIKTDLYEVLGQLLELRAPQLPGEGEEGHQQRRGGGRKRKLANVEEAWEEVSGGYEALKEGWRKVLDATHQRSVLSASVAKKFKAVNQGLWPHVEASLADRDRALRRSHQAVGAVAYLGRGVEGGVDGEGVDLECYDDSELYQHLLKEFMDNTGGRGCGDGPADASPHQEQEDQEGRGGSQGQQRAQATLCGASKARAFHVPCAFAPTPHGHRPPLRLPAWCWPVGCPGPTKPIIGCGVA